MRVLVVGAGAVGGYFGGRLLAAERDVTFLVRPRRAEMLAAGGLRIQSPHGDAAIPHPPVVVAENLRQPYDLVLLSCKAYDLESALAAMTPAVGTGTAILPLLNGMRHLDLLEDRFGAQTVLGGQCRIAATLAPDGAILHLQPMHELSFGERAGGRSVRVDRIAALFQGAGFDASASDTIVLEMWEKWIMLASAAAGTCLMRGSVGAIVAAPGGGELMLALIAQAAAIAAAAGYPPRPEALERARALLTAAGSGLTASMLRDLERGAPVESDHILGDLLQRERGFGLAPPSPSPLALAYAHLKVYESTRSAPAGVK